MTVEPDLDATRRQREVMDLVTAGLRYRQVAERLAISERQVQRHVSQAVARSGARTVYELAWRVSGGDPHNPGETGSSTT